ncbi:MAG TPA: ABC transporter ATP-binding protein [Pseudobacteroides sp.]|uniref:ABC transporter ATP-binding protein n=1 Tax=Pseudobacteroides sp. TaxID=1968840 RepID=UPI002F93C5E2
MSNIIEISGLHKTYSRGKVPTHALRGIDLVIEAGKFNCIIGPSGHGKSTLLHLIGGLDRPNQGSIKVSGEEINKLSDRDLAKFRAKKLGFVFQFFNLLNSLTVLENVQTPMMFAKIPKEQQFSRAIALLKAVGLEEKINSRANELSGGQMQRVAIARALANNPDILLMDEPTGNLDSTSEKEVMDIIFDLHKKGKTIVMVTHNPDISSCGERIIKIKDGIVQN